MVLIFNILFLFFQCFSFKVDAWVTAVEEILEFNLSEQELLSSVSAKLKNSTTMCLDRFTLADIMVWTVLAKNDSVKNLIFL